jgi:hypothetical protein
MKKRVRNQNKGIAIVKNQRPESYDSNWIAGFAAMLILLASTGAHGQESCQVASTNLSAPGEVDVALAAFGARLVAVGRVDAVSSTGAVEILGLIVQSVAGESFQVGDYAAVIDWSRRGSRDRTLEVRALASRYVPGASEVYLKSKVAVADPARGRVTLGKVGVDYTATSMIVRPSVGLRNSVVAVRGIQPSPRGTILGSCATATFEAAPRARGGRADGSLGTGSPDGSLGTGSPDGSLGTGSPDGSLGTGSPTAHWVPAVPTVHWAPAVLTAHWALAAPMAHWAPAVPTAHWALAVPTAHWALAAPMAHWAPAVPTARWGPAAPTVHWVPAAPTVHWEPAVLTARWAQAVLTARWEQGHPTRVRARLKPTAAPYTLCNRRLGHSPSRAIQSTARTLSDRHDPQ